MSGGGKGKRGHEEEHENHERWLVTYADMVTLLMVLFIVMFAMSQVDEKKFNALKAGMAAGFGNSTSIMDGSDKLLDQPGLAIAAPIAPSKVAPDLPPEQQAAVADAVARLEALRGQRKRADAEVEVNRLEGIRKRILAALAKQGLAGDARITIDERGLVVGLVSRRVIFENDVAELSPRGREVIDVLLPVLSDLDEPLGIDGHTNQVDVKPKYYPTDWELSAARAVRVLRYLNEVGGIPNERMTASAFGHERPAVDPRKPGSQRVNKRVDIVVMSTLPTETRALIEPVLTQRKQGGHSS